MLVTTHRGELAVGHRHIEVDRLAEDDALSLVADWLHVPVEQVPSQADPGHDEQPQVLDELIERARKHQKEFHKLAASAPPEHHGRMSQGTGGARA
jgi:hypothetical protein